MNNFMYYTPTKVYFGRGMENKIGEICAGYGYKKVFIVYGGESAVKSGLIQRVEDSLAQAGIVTDKAGKVQPNPLITRTREIIAQTVVFEPDLILAVGGGSVIDTAKTVAHGTANPKVDVWDYFTKKAEVKKSIPVATILTISAAGSEMSDSAVQTNPDCIPPMKGGVNTEFNRCVFAVLNPELTSTLPVFQIGAGAADIFLHTSERYFTTADLTGNHMSDEIAEGLFRNIIKYGPKGVKNPNDYEAMSEIMWSSTISHNDLTGLGTNPNAGRGGDWACHQLGHSLSAIYNVTHGASLAAVWGSWARYTCDANIARFAQYARNVWKLDGDDEATAKEAIVKTEEWFRSLGMATNISDLLGKEVTDEAVEELAYNCSRKKSRTIGELKILNHDDIAAIYKMAR